MAPAKLRLAFEVAPIALLVEGAEGETSDGTKSALDVVRRQNNRIEKIIGFGVLRACMRI